jgi:hypothetical protein
MENPNLKKICIHHFDLFKIILLIGNLVYMCPQNDVIK